MTSRTLQAMAGSLFLAAAVSASHIPSEPPRLLSETGLYAGRGTMSIDPRNRPFSPQYPLWSDGAEKSRWIRLPEGAAIDASNVDRWDFPEGTRFWKEFRFNGRKVETRFLRKNGDGAWTFASYAWNEEQSDALLAPVEGLPNVVEIAPGKFHSIPSVNDCRACHDSDGPVDPSDLLDPSDVGSGFSGTGLSRTNILGFTALQLSTDRDPGAPHAEPLGDDMMTLRTLSEERRLEPARPELVTAPPRIQASDARTRSVLGYLSTNCGSCHNQESSIANLGLTLKATAALSDPRTAAPSHLFKPTSKWFIPRVAESESRYVTPGVPELSAILVRMKSRRPSSQMPPLGTVLPDAQAIALVNGWIAEMGESE